MLIVALTNIAQFLQPLLSGQLGRFRRCPLNRGFTVFRNVFKITAIIPETAIQIGAK